MKKFLISKQINRSLLHEIKKIYQKKNKTVLKEFLLTNKKFINFIKQSENKIRQNSVKGIIISFSLKHFIGNSDSLIPAILITSFKLLIFEAK